MKIGILGSGGEVIFFGVSVLFLKTQADKTLPLDERRAIFIAGDDSVAKETVAKLIESIGFAAVDSGFLSEGGRNQQPGSAIYNKELTAADAAKALTMGA